jgi:hypothetical protein
MVQIILKEDIDTIAEAMKCEDDVCGYIDRDSGEVLIGKLEYPIDNTINEDTLTDGDSDYGYLPIPNMGSRVCHQDMIRFIEIIKDKKLQDLLSVCAEQPDAFEIFNHLLAHNNYKLERERWISFSSSASRDRVLEWLISQNFSVVDQ